MRRQQWIQLSIVLGMPRDVACLGPIGGCCRQRCAAEELICGAPGVAGPGKAGQEADAQGRLSCWLLLALREGGVDGGCLTRAMILMFRVVDIPQRSLVARFSRPFIPDCVDEF